MRLSRSLSLFLLVTFILILPAHQVFADEITPAQAAEEVRANLVQAQLARTSNPGKAAELISGANDLYVDILSPEISALAPEIEQRIQTGFEQLSSTSITNEAFAYRRATIWTAILEGSYHIVLASIHNGDLQLAQSWLSVREYRQATRFSRPNADATLALAQLQQEKISREDAILALNADLLDTYQARLNEALHKMPEAESNDFTSRQAELAGLAQGYFAILAPAYLEQRGQTTTSQASEAFTHLQSAALAGDPLEAPLARVNAQLDHFRAAPLSAAEQARRAGQMLRFLSLVPMEYGRGVSNEQVTQDLEIQEAITFHSGAFAAFTDLQDLLDEIDSEATGQAEAIFIQMGQQLNDADQRRTVVKASIIQKQTAELQSLLEDTMPEEWMAGSTQGDFDVVDSMLDQMETAVRGGEYQLAETARLEAYAVVESGPEARLMVFAPDLSQKIEDLFWNGRGEHTGLQYLIEKQANLQEIRASRQALDMALQEAQGLLSQQSLPAAVAVNAGLIVFREGLEAVIILASLMGSMKKEEEQKYRKPMWLGSGLALLFTALTWLLAHGVLKSLARYGEKLEAIVSLIAISMLLVILNWFFHKTYWINWIANFHRQKKRMLSGETGLVVGLVVLGFTSVYREGFETVLFLQALVLEGGSSSVLIGTLIAAGAVLLVGLVTFRLQVNLPYKDILIYTGILIGLVLVQIVGKTVHVMQVLGWLPIHLIPGLQFPLWMGTWLGLYATFEGLGLQLISAAFVIGSYFLAERQHRQRREERRGRKKVNTAVEV